MKVFWIAYVLRFFFERCEADHWQYIGFYRTYKAASEVTAAVWYSYNLRLFSIRIQTNK